MVALACGACLFACRPLRRGRSTTRNPSASGHGPGGDRSRSDPGTRSAAGLGPLELELKAIHGSGALASQTGHCDLDGVLASEGSERLARLACERDRGLESDLADGLVLSAASSVHHQGRERHRAGDLEGARLDYAEAIALDERLPSSGTVALLARVNLGLLHYEQGDAQAARAELNRVLDNTDEPAVRGAAYHNLALVELEQGDTARALELALRAHDLLYDALGAAHGSVGAALNTLGVIHAERDELDEAIEQLEHAIEVRTAALGAEHPATAASHTNLGIALGRRGRWEASLGAHRQALAIDQEVLGVRHATTAADHGHVGAALVELGRPEGARRSFREALAILEPLRPADDPEVEALRRWLLVCDEAEAKTDEISNP